MTPYEFIRSGVPRRPSNAEPLRSTSSTCAGYSANRRRPRTARPARRTASTPTLARTPAPTAGLPPESAVTSPAYPEGEVERSGSSLRSQIPLLSMARRDPSRPGSGLATLPSGPGHDLVQFDSRCSRRLREPACRSFPRDHVRIGQRRSGSARMPSVRRLYPVHFTLPYSLAQALETAWHRNPVVPIC